MTEMKKWSPFRFLRQNRRNPEMPARTGASMPLTLTAMRDEMDRMFERFWTNPLVALDSQDRWFGDFSQEVFQPKLDVTDDKNCLRVALEVPGVDMKDLNVEVQDGVMTVSGEKKQEETSEEEGCYRTERSYGYFKRSIPLPAEVEAQKAEAKFDKGVLTIKLPKSERARQGAQKIPVKA
jgi:HSP20 family protein